MGENKINPNQAAVPEKKIEKVISGTAKTKQKSGVSKVTNALFAEDFKSVIPFVIDEYVIPIFKKGMYEAFNAVVETLIYGKDGRPKKSNSSNNGRPSYQGYYDKRDREKERGVSASRNWSDYQADDIWLENRGDAETVLWNMRSYVEEYGTVSVAEAKQFAGLPFDYPDHNYGWTDLRSAYVSRFRDGHLVVLPQAVWIKSHK